MGDTANQNNANLLKAKTERAERNGARQEEYMKFKMLMLKIKTIRRRIKGIKFWLGLPCVSNCLCVTSVDIVLFIYFCWKRRKFCKIFSREGVLFFYIYTIKYTHSENFVSLEEYCLPVCRGWITEQYCFTVFYYNTFFSH